MLPYLLKLVLSKKLLNLVMQNNLVVGIFFFKENKKK